MIIQHLKRTWRNVRANKATNFLNIFGLSIGIACAGLIFLWVEDELKWDAHHIKKENLYDVRVNQTFFGSVYTMGSTPRPMAAAMKKDFPGIVNTARMSDGDQEVLLSDGNKKLYAKGRYADPSLFSMFTLPFVEGNAASAFSELYSIVLTQKAAIRFFGSEKEAVGKVLRMNNEKDFKVTGVLKDIPPNSTIQFEWAAPYEISMVQQREKWGESDADRWNSYGPHTFVELAQGVKVADVNKQLHNYISAKNPEQKSTSFLFNIKRWHLYDEFANGLQTGGGQIEQVRLLSVIAWLILIVACINFMNLATARSEKRAREVGVRKVLGSGRKQLIIQFITETMIASAAAGVIAILLIAAALPSFNDLVGKQLAIHPADSAHIFFLLSIIFICGILAGSYPSLYLSSFKPAIVLKGLKVKGSGASLIRKGLVVTQFTVSIVFIITTIIVYRQIQHVKNRDLGFAKDNLVEIHMQKDFANVFPVIRKDLLSTGVVQNAAMADHEVIEGGNTDDRFKWQGKPENSQVALTHRVVSPEFISVAGIKLLEGKDFDGNSPANNTNVIISESLARLLGTGSAVGKIIQSPRGMPMGEFKNVTVSGVVEDHVYGNVYGTPGPMIYFCAKPEYGYLLYARIKPNSNLTQALSKIEKVIQKNNPEYPFEYKFVDDQFNTKFKNESMTSKLSAVFAVLSVLISCLGLFGLAAYMAESRVKEIGIRKVLGASVANIARLLSKDFVLLISLACLIAFPLAWWIMSGWLNNFEYRVTIGWWIFALAGLGAIFVALATISFQAIKAAVANPARSLRAD